MLYAWFALRATHANARIPGIYRIITVTAAHPRSFLTISRLQSLVCISRDCLHPSHTHTHTEIARCTARVFYILFAANRSSLMQITHTRTHSDTITYMHVMRTLSAIVMRASHLRCVLVCSALVSSASVRRRMAAGLAAARDDGMASIGFCGGWRLLMGCHCARRPPSVPAVCAAPRAEISIACVCARRGTQRNRAHETARNSAAQRA